MQTAVKTADGLAFTSIICQHCSTSSLTPLGSDLRFVALALPLTHMTAGLCEDELNIPPEATIQPCVPVSLVSAATDKNAAGAVTTTIRLDPTIKKGNATGTPSGAATDKGDDESDRDTKREDATRCFVVGRQASSSDIRIQHASISRRHAVLYAINRDDDDNRNDASPTAPSAAAAAVEPSCRLFLKDLGGKHGTLVNGQRVAGVAELRSGDEIQFGNVRQIFRVQIGGGMFLPERAGSSVEEADHSQATDKDDEAPKGEPSLDEGQAQASVDQSRIERAGQGLSGRAKRQAEIAAMMASLDAAPVYSTAPSAAATLLEHSERPAIDEVDATEADDRARFAREHGIPITQRLTIPSEMKGSTKTTANDHPGGKRGGVATCLAVDSAGSRFVLGSSDNHLRFYDVGGMRKNRLESFLDVVPEDGHLLQSVVFSPSGDRLLVATSSVQPTVFDRDGHVVVQFCRGDMYVTDPAKTVGHTAQVTSVDWHPLERDVVLTGSLDGSARLWNLHGKTQFDKLVCDKVFAVKSVKGQRTAVTSVAFHPGGREFAVGTSCGSIQIFNRSRVSATRPERALYGAHGGREDDGTSNGAPVTSLAYSVDGSKLASRCSQDSTVRVWDPRRLSRSSTPVVDCQNVESIHDNANACFNSDGSLLCVGQSMARRAGTVREESGSLLIFQVPDSDDFTSSASSSAMSSKNADPLLILPFDDAAPLIVRWHVKLNQIFVACADGRMLILFDPQLSAKGGGLLVSTSRASRDVDDLSKLLKLKAEASTTVTGEIYTPLTMPRGKPLLESEKKRQRLERKDPVKSHEPERPATGKHKSGGQAGGNVTFQQFVADQRVSKSKAIAGKDPREALFQYTEGANYVGNAYEGNVHKLAEKTAEEEQEELKKAGR
jgi:WD repeat-containing protein 70